MHQKCDKNAENRNIDGKALFCEELRLTSKPILTLVCRQFLKKRFD